MIHLKRDNEEFDDELPVVTQSEERGRQPIQLASDQEDFDDELPGVTQSEERGRQPVRLDELEMLDELPTLTRCDGRNSQPIQLAELEATDEFPSVIRREERITPSPEPSTPSVYQQTERNNTPSEDRITLSRDVLDELFFAIRYGLQSKDTGSPGSDSPEPSILENFDVDAQNFDGLSKHYIELIKVQNYLSSKLTTLETLHEDLSDEFEARVHSIPGLSKFSLPIRKREEYRLSTYWPHDADDEKYCECPGCFTDLKSRHADAVRAVRIIRSELALVKKEHLELLEEFETFLDHREELIARSPITRME